MAWVAELALVVVALEVGSVLVEELAQEKGSAWEKELAMAWALEVLDCHNLHCSGTR